MKDREKIDHLMQSIKLELERQVALLDAAERQLEGLRLSQFRNASRVTMLVETLEKAAAHV
jgi:excinuclease UvrABC helicase subunit UvrB